MHFRQCVPNLLAGRDRAADRFVCFSLFSLFGLLSCPRGWGQSTHMLCFAEPLCAPPPRGPALLCAQRRGQGPAVMDCVHLSLLPSRFWTRLAIGTRGQERDTGHLFSWPLLPGWAPRLKGLPHPHQAALSSSPAPPWSLGISFPLLPASQCLFTPY